MRKRLLRDAIRSVAIGCLLTVAVLTPSTAQAATPRHVVFVQTNDPSGNSILAYDRGRDGRLSLAGTFPTGGVGARESGAGSDPLASQGSLLLDPADDLLFAVNAGSNTVSVLRVVGDRLRVLQVLSSGGAFPVGFARQGSLLYVLDAGGPGAVAGYRIGDAGLTPLSGSVRSLGLSNADTPFFLSSPAQVGFTPSGRQLLVTTKTNGTVEVFTVNPTGRLSRSPVSDPIPGVPFAFRFDAGGRLVLVSAASGLSNGSPIPDSGSLGTYTVNADGSLTAVSGPVSNGQSAPCWIATLRGFDFVANTGSGTISRYTVDGSGGVTLDDAAAASGYAGPTDLTTSGDFLYNQVGQASTVTVFGVNAAGALTQVQSVLVPDGSDQEGLAAS
jgi:6-phosphogluconolactonase (cycloisomerase 2 family)